MTAVVVAGFHRSGTSLLTQLLNSAGLFVGDDLLGANPSNPYGHFEDREVVSLHDAILQDNGLTWQVTQPFVPFVSPHRWQALRAFVETRNQHHALWGFKDPRVCLFLGIWSYVVPGMRVVVTYRHPADAAYSLERRHAAHILSNDPPLDVHRRLFEVPDLSLRMWIAYNRPLIQYASEHPDTTLVIPSSWIRKGYPAVDVLAKTWKLPLRPTPNSAIFDPTVTSSRPRRQIVYDTRLLDEVEELWINLEQLATNTPKISPEDVS